MERNADRVVPAPLLWAGDIMACWGADRVSRIISGATWSPFAPSGLRWGPSHVAIISPDPKGSGLDWIESTTKAPGGRDGVQAHRPSQRIRDYLEAGGRVEVFRPSALDLFNDNERRLMRELLRFHFLDKAIPYDMAGALISGTRVFKFSRLLTSDPGSLFCSELIALLLMRLGRLNRSNPTRYNPATLLRELVRQGTYQNLGRAVPTDDGEENAGTIPFMSAQKKSLWGRPFPTPWGRRAA